MEAHYFLHRLEQEYHDPQLFRFHLNAFISALRAVHELLQRELERAGQVQWWNERRREFAEDLVLRRFARGRNLSLHQRAILDGSRVTVGMFRYRRLKLAMETNVKTDETSESRLRRLTPELVGSLVDKDHGSIGEEAGVLREYFVPELSDEEDVLRACLRALARTSKALAEAHNRLGAQHEPTTDEDVVDARRLAEVMVLVESDLDPELPDKWGW